MQDAAESLRMHQPSPVVEPPRLVEDVGWQLRVWREQDVLVLEGELDIATAPILEAALVDAERRRGTAPLIVDLRGLEFMSCGGVSLLVAAAERERRTGRRLVVMPGTGAPARLLGLCGLDEALGLLHDPPAAILEEGPSPVPAPARLWTLHDPPDALLAAG